MKMSPSFLFTIKKAAGDAVSDAGSTVKDSLMNATVAIHVAAKVSSAEYTQYGDNGTCTTGRYQNSGSL